MSHKHMTATSLAFRILRAISVAVCIVASVPVSASDVVIIRAPINSNNLPLFAAPYPTATVIAELPDNTKVHVFMDVGNDWKNIEVVTMGNTGRPPPNPLSGYINGRFVNPNTAVPAPAPPPISSQTAPNTPPKNTGTARNDDGESLTFTCRDIQTPCQVADISVRPQRAQISIHGCTPPTSAEFVQGRQHAATISREVVREFVHISSQKIHFGEEIVADSPVRGISRDVIIDRATGIAKIYWFKLKCIKSTGR